MPQYKNINVITSRWEIPSGESEKQKGLSSIIWKYERQLYIPAELVGSRNFIPMRIRFRYDYIRC